MDLKDLYKELEKDNAAQIILALSKLYNQLRQQRLVKWVEAYPEYWHMLCCNPASPETARSVTPEIAEQVMQNTAGIRSDRAADSAWLFRYGTLLDIFSEMLRMKKRTNSNARFCEHSIVMNKKRRHIFPKFCYSIFSQNKFEFFYEKACQAEETVLL